MATVWLTRCVTLVLAGASAAAVGGCWGGDDGAPDRSAGKNKSPVTGEVRAMSESKGLSPLLVTANQPAIPFKGSDGKHILTYELRLANVTPLTLTPTRVRISSPDGSLVKSLDQRQVAAALALPSVRSGVRELTEGQLATLYITLDFDRESAIPTTLEHTVTVTGGRLPPRGVKSTPATAVEVKKDFEVPVMGPPLRAGKGFVAADSCCANERHRRALLPVDGRQWLSQRFAVDWEQLDASGRFVTRGGDPADPADYTIYGKQTIAAADATIVSVLDGLPDQKPGALPEGIAPTEVDGNSIIAKTGQGLYMLYGHMQAGSIKVKKGDTVKRGDPVGLVGNSGNSSAPHLHFHVMDGPSPLSSEGVPYVIDSFTTTGRIRSTAVFDEFENTTRPFEVLRSRSDGKNENEMPLDLTIVELPE